MARTLAELAPCGAPLEARLRVAAGLARAVAALHRRREVHGALSPETAVMAGGDDPVVLAPPGARASLALAGWAAPEVLRGGRPTRRSDAFAAAALAQLALTGHGPFDGDGADGPERVRRTLFEAPRPARLDLPALPVEVGEALARALDRRAGRRGTAEELERALVGGLAAVRAGATATATPTATAMASGVSSTSTSTTTTTELLARMGALRAALAALLRRLPPSPLHRAALAAAPLLVLAILFVPRSDAALTREVGRALERGDLAAARAALDAAPAGADRAVVQKLRGDLACARRAPDECLRRYRTALAARPALRGDEALRRNVRALLARDEGCGTRRAAALLAGELRDPEALPVLQAARQSQGFLAALCTGDAFDRAIAATRAASR